MNKQRVLIFIIALIGIVAFFLPWMKIGELSKSINGSHGWNFLVLLFFIIPAIVAWVGNLKQRITGNELYTVVIAGLFCVVRGVVIIVRINSSLPASDDLTPLAEMITSSISIQFGLYLVIFAGLGLVIAPFLVKGRNAA